MRKTKLRLKIIAITSDSRIAQNAIRNSLQFVRFQLWCCVAVRRFAMPLGRKKKRSGRYSPASRLLQAGQDVLRHAADWLQLRTPALVFHMDVPADREALIDALWSDALLDSTARFSTQNSHLVALFSAQQLDDAGPPAFRERAFGWPRFEHVFTALFRARSQKLVPLETAAMSVQWLHYRVPEPVWHVAAHATRLVMSHSWTVHLVEDAIERDPGPRYPVAGGITAAVFDNLSMQIAYGSYATTESSGQRFDMTNWATVFIPQMAVPADFSMDAMLGGGGLFRDDVELDHFIELFSPLSPEIEQHQRQRWSKFLEMAESQTGMWNASQFKSPYPPTAFHYHPPIFGRLQSSYEDVNFEMNTMRRSRFHKYADAVMLGGDGLSYMRLIHRLSQDPRRFLETKPIVIPRMGEAPHGKFHLMHGDWRIWSPLIMRMAEVLGNRQVRADPSVSDFNSHEHFLRILTTAFAEYVVEISKTGTDYHLTARFLAATEHNLSFAYVVHFLYLFAFKYLSFRDAVRCNDSAALDLLWRENLASARTSLANKKNYSQMSVVLVYWGACLREPLQTIYHNTRTLRWINNHVGWDMPIEKLNMWIKESVVAQVTFDLIIKFTRYVNFTHVVIRALKRVFKANRADVTAGKLKNIRADVELIKSFLREKIGSTFGEATAECHENVLAIDVSQWGGQRNVRSRAPWEQMKDHMEDYREYVRSTVVQICPWHHWK